MADKYLDSYIKQNEDSFVREMKEKSRENSKRLRDEHISYKILKTKASSHIGAYITGQIMEWYYKKFTDYSSIE